MAEVGGSVKVMVLGVEHSAQLVSRSYQPALFRAFFDRCDPAVLCVERSPEEFSRRSFYEFTYEVQHLLVPHAQARGVPVCPIDWITPAADAELVWGLPDITAPPVVRNPPPADFQGFLVFQDPAVVCLDLFSAESEASRRTIRSWYDAPRRPGRRDFPRRLGLYRTYMQAMRIAAVTRSYPGQTCLVVVGTWHKDDIEQVLADEETIDVVQPSTVGRPTEEEVDAWATPEDLLAIATFNLLGLQATFGVRDDDWIDDVVARLPDAAPETPLLRIRHEILRRNLAPDRALAALRHACAGVPETCPFTFDGVTDRGRIDSYYDPFGNLDVRQRMQLEIGRELHRGGDPAAAEDARQELQADPGLNPLQRLQLDVYWRQYLTAAEQPPNKPTP